MTEKKREEFTVTDKRKFTLEGELRSDAPPQPETPPAPPAPEVAPPPAAKAPPAAQSAPGGATQSPAATQPSAGGDFGAVPSPPSAAEQKAQQEAYSESRRMFEPSPLSGRAPQDYEMTFERLAASLYMTAMMQLGLLHEQSGQPVADFLAAKQTIDTLALLQEKTKGNLTDAEQNLLQNCLYELRMAFVEMTNAVARASQNPPPGSPK